MDSLEKKLFIIGLGIGKSLDLPLTIMQILNSVDVVYLEIYTNFTEYSLKEYQKSIDTEIIPVYRSSLENDSKKFLKNMKGKNVALLISGDPFIATTHYSLLIEALDAGLDVNVYNNTSIVSLAPSLLGLSSYKFGKTATIPFKERIISEIPYLTLKANLKSKNHTLFLLDIDLEANEFMSINEALENILQLETKIGSKIVSEDTHIIGLGKLGHLDSKILFGSVNEILKFNWRNLGPPQAIVFPGELNPVESENLEKLWRKSGYQPKFLNKKKKIVVTGTFDVLHPGHISFFKNAKKMLIPSELWVIVARNSSVNSFKKRDPILEEDVRLSMVKELRIVDHAVLGNEGPDKIKILEEIKPDLIVLDYDQWIKEEKLSSELNKRGLQDTKIIRLGKYGNDGSSSSTEIREKIASTVLKNDE